MSVAGAPRKPTTKGQPVAGVQCRLSEALQDLGGGWAALGPSCAKGAAPEWAAPLLTRSRC